MNEHLTKMFNGCLPLSISAKNSIVDVLQGLIYSSESTIISHCMESVHIRSFSGPYFPAFERKKEIHFSVLVQRKSTKGLVNNFPGKYCLMSILRKRLQKKEFVPEFFGRISS